MSQEDKKDLSSMQQNQQEEEIVPDGIDFGADDLSGDFGDFDQMFDPVQAFGQLFVAQSEKANGGAETIAEILASIRDILDKGVKVLYKMSLNQQQKQ